MTTMVSNRRPGHTSEIKTNYKSAYVGALEPIMAELTEGTTGDASSSSTVAVSSGVNHFGHFSDITFFTFEQFPVLKYSSTFNF